MCLYFFTYWTGGQEEQVKSMLLVLGIWDLKFGVLDCLVFVSWDWDWVMVDRDFN